MEAAETVDVAGIIKSYGENRSQPEGRCRLELADLLTLFQLEQLIADMRRDESPGPSMVRNEICLQNVPWAARLWFPLVIKSLVRLVEPLAFSTSVLFILYKGIEPQSTAANHRKSIYLLEGLGKCSRKCLPLLLNPLTERLRLFFMDAVEVPTARLLLITCSCG